MAATHGNGIFSGNFTVNARQQTTLSAESIYDIEIKAYGDYDGPKNQYVTDVGERKSIEIRKIHFDHFVKFFDIID